MNTQQYGQIPGQVNPMMQQQMPGQMPNYGQQQQQQMPGQMPGQMPNYGQQYTPATNNEINYNIGNQANQNYGQQNFDGNSNRKESTVIEVTRSNYTTIALFEVSGGFDPAMKFPKSLCFVMGVPGVKDASKQSGRTYLQAQKIVMKFSTQEIRSLGQSLINIATFKQAAPAFEKHSDPSKNTYTQGQNANQQNTKKLKAAFDQSRSNIVISMNYGQNNVMIPVPLQDALGLGHDLINIGNFADNKLAEHKLAHRIGKEEITGIDFDPVGTEDHLQQPQQMGYGQQAIPQQPHQPIPGYNQQVQQQMPGQGMPGVYQGMPGVQ